MSNRRPKLVVNVALVVALGLSGCRSVGKTANEYFDWGGRTFTTNPASVDPYCIGFGAFFIAGLPLDLFSWIGTSIAWPEGRGEDYQGAALGPSIFMGTTGGALLGAPFWPFGLPWWNPDREDAEAPASEEPKKKEAPMGPKDEAPAPARGTDPTDPGEIPAGAPRR